MPHVLKLTERCLGDRCLYKNQLLSKTISSLTSVWSLKIARIATWWQPPLCRTLAGLQHFNTNMDQSSFAKVNLQRLHQYPMFGINWIHIGYIEMMCARRANRGFVPANSPRWMKASHDTHVTKVHNGGRPPCQSVTLVRHYYFRHPPSD